MYMKKNFRLIIDKLNSSRMDSQLISEIAKICRYAVQADLHFPISSDIKYFINDILISFIGEPKHIKPLITTNISDFTSFLWWRKYLETFLNDCELTQTLIRETNNFINSSVCLSQELLEEELLEIKFLSNTLSYSKISHYHKLFNTLMLNRLLLNETDLSTLSTVIGILNRFEGNSVTQSIFLHYVFSDNLDMILHYATMFDYKINLKKKDFERLSISQIVGMMILQEEL